MNPRTLPTRTIVVRPARTMRIATIGAILAAVAVSLSIVVSYSTNELPKFSAIAGEMTTPKTQTSHVKTSYALPEFNGFAEETPIPKTLVSPYMNWDKIYKVKTTSRTGS